MRKILTAIVGFVLLALGFILLFIPGPGLLLIGLGLVVLSVEFEFARKATARFRRWREKRPPSA